MVEIFDNSIKYSWLSIGWGLIGAVSEAPLDGSRVNSIPTRKKSQENVAPLLCFAFFLSPILFTTSFFFFVCAIYRASFVGNRLTPAQHLKMRQTSLWWKVERLSFSHKLLVFFFSKKNPWRKKKSSAGNCHWIPGDLKSRLKKPSQKKKKEE